ncbi:hypothetical protein ARNL5_02976 [Anaerolineae bacterium]|nr:hypothetical protein ARNL5_02976 [Anaerolineae bacterium]
MHAEQSMWPDFNSTEVTFLCPTCGHTSVLIRAGTVNWTDNAFAPSPDAFPSNCFACLYQCRICLRAVLIMAQGISIRNPRLKSSNARLSVLPHADYQSHESIPPDIAAAMREAVACMSVGAWNASGTMCRRALELAMRHLSVSGKNLQTRIDNSAAKGVPPQLVEIAHTIRLVGNEGAHPDEDFPSLTETDARRGFEFATTLFKTLFVLPAEIEQVDERHRKK